MATIIKIPATAFNAGGPLEAQAAAQARVRIPVGISTDDGEREALLATYASDDVRRNSKPGILMISVHDISMDNGVLTRMSQAYKNTLAHLISKGAVEVAIDGVVQTAIQVAAL